MIEIQNSKQNTSAFSFFVLHLEHLNFDIA